MVSEGGGPWSGDEIDVVVASYFGMLRAELAEQPSVKACINREGQALTGRSRGSVERKFQKHQRHLALHGGGVVDGYKPLSNVQQALREAVINRWMAEPDIEDLMLAQVVLPVGPPRVDLIWTVSQPPTSSADSSVMEGRARIQMRLDFVKLEADKPKTGLYTLAGSLESSCWLTPTTWLARPA